MLRGEMAHKGLQPDRELYSCSACLDPAKESASVSCEVDVLTSQQDPKTGEEFLTYSQDITLDPNTVNTWQVLSDGNRKVTEMCVQQSDPSHPDRFTGLQQVLSKDGLTRRCYREVEWGGIEASVAVSYKNINRQGWTDNSKFGRNDKSWALECNYNYYNFWYNNIQTSVKGPQSFKIGVHLDHSAGTLSFYSIIEKMTLLHRVQTTFTQPLYAGFRLEWVDDCAVICQKNESEVN